MVLNFSPAALLNPQTAEKLNSGQYSDDSLHEFFRANPEEPLLDAWLLANLSTPPEYGQKLLRIARKAHSYWKSSDGKQHLLVGIPLVRGASAGNASWQPLRHEFEQATGAALEQLSAQVHLAGYPVSASVLHVVGASELGSWCEQLHRGGDPSKGLHEPQATGPAVWVGLVSVPKDARTSLEDLFFKVNPEVSRLFSSVNVRFEALAEVQGIRLRVFPPTAIWNSLSISRLVHARLQLGPFKRQPGLWHGVLEQGTATLYRGTDPVLALPFPEEIVANIAPLFNGWATLRE